MKIVLLCTAQANQVALANKIAGEFNLAGIVVEKKKINTTKKYTLKNIVSKVAHKIFFQKIIQAWWQMLSYYKKKYNSFPRTKIIEINSINDKAVEEFIKSVGADLVMVSGTSMVRKNILSIPLSVGMINLHTGLSPYIKGAPNCTNWCISNNEIHLIGNSIMWIDAGIDSGDLLATAIVRFNGNENLTEVHIKVMENAHALYLQAVRSIRNGTAKRVKQDSIAKGTTYYMRDWNFRVNKNLLKNLKHFSETIHSDKYKELLKNTITVS